ncbi:hypothetical protein OAS39_05190 [Pirellulales bacterium]|nr:hypothetical protein [Pirellulales bacterium]
MTADRNARLLVHGRSPGDWNMAVDKLLLDQAISTGVAALRLYQWETATLSLGYFQSIQQRASHSASRDAPAVRRLTGGGALVHDRELTYALALPAKHPLTREHRRLYEVVHGWFLAMLSDFGVAARLCGCDSDGQECESSSTSPFLCFQRRSSFDLVVDGQPGGATAKILGSAQRRRRGAVLQHGALLLAASDAAPELPGVADLQGGKIAPDDAAARLAELARAELNIPRLPGSLDSSELDQAAGIAKKYAAGDWLKRR